MNTIIIEVPTRRFEYNTPGYWWAYSNSPVWYDGATVYSNTVQEEWQEEGFSSDGYRRTGGHATTSFRQGNPIEGEIPSDAMAVIREAWDQHLVEQQREQERIARQQEQERREEESRRLVTIGGITHPVWVWRYGASVTTEPTPQEREILAAIGCVIEPNGSNWYILEPRYED